ncbi:hypothetical protein [Kordiimonas sp. SCSIO 12610]|uniref:hypothetical protein n=1 Tax=Kordiimonas sp. SCSIO 12610 TaxID=2829597 RepID=UPI00210E7365|nr:hypothetical protein [Kordiimonas sp. SCSIO 12610]UTW54810.1 hypothetical protein KFF44_13500 [Kordiimonas sp. SCSIO 12610]
MKTARLERKRQDPLIWKQIWQRVIIEDVTSSDERIIGVVEKLKTDFVYGEVIFHQYQISIDADDNEQTSDNNFNMHDNLLDLLNHEKVKSDLPQIKTNTAKKDFKLEAISSYQFIADLAGILHTGGAYTPSGHIVGDKALILAKDFFEALYGSQGYQYHSGVIYRASTDWSCWFNNIFWDFVWFHHDFKKQIVTIFLGTDTD